MPLQEPIPLYVASFEVLLEATDLHEAELASRDLAQIIAEESITVLSVDVIVSEAPPKYAKEN